MGRHLLLRTNLRFLSQFVSPNQRRQPFSRGPALPHQPQANSHSALGMEVPHLRRVRSLAIVERRPTGRDA